MARFHVHIKYWPVVSNVQTSYAPIRNIDCDHWEMDNGVMTFYDCNAESDADRDGTLRLMTNWIETYRAEER